MPTVYSCVAEYTIFSGGVQFTQTKCSILGMISILSLFPTSSRSSQHILLSSHEMMLLVSLFTLAFLWSHCRMSAHMH